jgi:hypothetical protein
MKEKYFSIGAALLHHSRRRVLRRLVRKKERNLSENLGCAQKGYKKPIKKRISFNPLH